jgi:hypothetical protein
MCVEDRAAFEVAGDVGEGLDEGIPGAAKALLSVSSMARKKTSGVEAFAEEVDAD